MVEPRTGDVKALAQSRPMGRDRKKGETYLNYIVPKRYGDSAGFQAGSTFKAFVLAAAIQKGIPLDTRISAPSKISIPMSEYPTCGGHNYFSTDVWEPENSTDSGTFDLFTGTLPRSTRSSRSSRSRPACASPTDWPARWAST